MPISANTPRTHGRFFLTSAASLTTSLSQIAWDTNSDLLVPSEVALSSGDLQVGTAGPSVVSCAIKYTGVALLTGIKFRFTRAPRAGGAREKVFVDETKPAASSGTFTMGSSGSIDLDAGETVRIECAVVGPLGSVSLGVGDEVSTWVHLVQR